ncbi:TSUP family transporter [Rhodopila sp.]|uniref:TSUP family transporter n=1 Tax=Rhodopila sp. TaxID=2480087 RepID=UPI003D0AC579
MAVGSAFQAALGMGLALLVVPILALLDPGFIPGPMLLAGTVLTAMTAYQERDAIDRKGLAISLLGLLVGTVIGAVSLQYAAGPNVQRVFGAVILVAVLISVLGSHVVPNTRNLIMGGGAAGVMGTMVGIHGPPISLVFQGAEPRVARAMLGAFFTIAYLGSVAALALDGLFGRAGVERAVVLLPGVGIGLALAPVVRRCVNRRRLRVAILAVAAISGVLLVLK